MCVFYSGQSSTATSHVSKLCVIVRGTVHWEIAQALSMAGNPPPPSLCLSYKLLNMAQCDVPVPLQPFVVVAVEEVRLGSHRSDVGMQAQELQQRPRPSFLHPDDDRLGQLFTFRLIEETRHGIIVQRLRLASNLIPLLSSAVQIALVIQQVPGRP